MRELALFAGGGGGILGGYLMGWKTVCAVEIDNYARNILLARQRDGILPAFPIWDDIKTFDGRPWAGRCDIITGGFPCQDISLAGKGEGITGPKSKLWKPMSRVVREVGPEFVLVENSPALTLRGLGTVLGDLVKMGYDARWCVLGANDAGAPHIRKRIWILAYPGRKSWKKQKKTGREKGYRIRDKGQNVPDTNGQRCKERNSNILDTTGWNWTNGSGIDWWNIDPANLPDTTEKRFQDRTEKEINQETEKLKRLLRDKKDWPAQSFVGRVANGIPHRVDRLKTLGNAQVPAVAALAFLILSEGII